MTTAKQALDDIYLETNDTGFVYIVSNGKRIASIYGDLDRKHEIGNKIIRALRVLNAVESGRLVMESKFEYGDFALCEVNGKNACLEQLKRIGDGE